MHNRLGVWALPFHFTLALTGALLGLSTLIVAALSLLLYRGDMSKVYQLFLDPPPPVDARAVPMPDITALLAKARLRMPGAEPQNVMIERHGRADMRIAIHAARARLLVPQDEMQFDASGRIVAEEHPKDFVVGIKVLSGIGQIHFGWYGGLPVRIAYGLLGLALCIVTSSGVTIWLARRRDRGRAAPHWERIWAAVCWGQPVVLVMTAILALASKAISLPIAWLGLTVLSIAGAASMRGTGTILGRNLRRSLGVLILLMAFIHAMFALAGGRLLVVDGLLLIGGLVLVKASSSVMETSGHVGSSGGTGQGGAGLAENWRLNGRDGSNETS